ncbi:zinc finger protein OZF-like [Culex quinquefasciatus]|uniref:zinc finger protein OZF-like n=1 Tax=Culex quinquefasciatus TaxID=7176 RepID=UPI0018E31DD2|nr:zinc finger protein OZF-like [Culex quinquefasciatus]
MDPFVNHCRLCRAENVPTESWPLLTQSGNEHLLEKIEACSSVQIRADDGLPQRICWRCEASLDHANSFRLQCQEADTWWRFNFEENEGKLAAIASVFVKPEVEEELDADDSSGHPMRVETVLKKEPMKFEDSAYEPAQNEPSTEEREADSKEEKATPKKKIRKEFRCDVCSRKLANKQNLQEHMSLHSGVQTFECSECDSKFFCAAGLKRHVDRKHPDHQPFQCDKCDRKYTKKSHLLEHQNTHSDARPYSCKLCPMAFKTKTNLNGHMRWVHQPEEVREELKKKSERICVCSYCGKISKSVSLHKKHLITHTGEKKYECQICNKRFTALWSHRKHMWTHTGERPYQCEFCQKAFRDKQHLTTHIRGVHTNERPFQCRLCPKAFVTRKNMQVHERTHGDPVLQAQS